MFLQTEIVKRMSAIIGQVLPFLSQEHQQQVATAVERAKQVTMSDLNSAVAGVGVSNKSNPSFLFCNALRVVVGHWAGQVTLSNRVSLES